MKKPIKTLIRLRKFELDEKRRVLAELEAKRMNMVNQIKAHDEMIASEAILASKDPHMAMHYGQFVKGTRRKQAEIQNRIDAMMPELETARDAVAEAFQEVKRYELMLQGVIEREQKEELDKENAMLDEMGLQVHRRNNEENQLG